MRSTITVMVLLIGFSYAQTTPPEPGKPAPWPVDANNPPDANTPGDAEMTDLPLPQKDSAEYWVLRSDAIQEFIPLLTKKRSEMKTRMKMLNDYLLQIGKASEFAAHDIPVTYNPAIYAEILKIGPRLRQMNIRPPNQRPTWDQLVEIAMQHVLAQGYLPADVEDSEMQQFAAACKKKEEYGQKVLGDIRAIMDQCVRMWIYLRQIGRLDDFKAHEADVAQRQEAELDAERQAAMKQKQVATRQRAEDRKQQEYEQRMARREFSSSRRELDYYYRQQQLLYRQSLLDQRFINSWAYPY
ncbi:MAG: hypothetical protein LLF76_10995 [Planctomycetaceae bacterium]|nr:hypothetical protein [Planctomycetaceae bacterium]